MGHASRGGTDWLRQRQKDIFDGEHHELVVIDKVLGMGDAGVDGRRLDVTKNIRRDFDPLAEVGDCHRHSD